MLEHKSVFIGIVAFVGVSAFAAPRGELTRLQDSEDEGLRYRCVAHSSAGAIKIEIELNTASGAMVVELNEGVRVRGIASETLDRKTNATHYFLQGGSAPAFQRLTLVTREGGKWARFTRAYGADEFVCEM